MEVRDCYILPVRIHGAPEFSYPAFLAFSEGDMDLSVSDVDSMCRLRLEMSISDT